MSGKGEPGSPNVTLKEEQICQLATLVKHVNNGGGYASVATGGIWNTLDFPLNIYVNLKLF